MAHFAQVKNGLVMQVLVVPDEQEHHGQQYLANDLALGGKWVQCSYNTHGGKHLVPGKQPLRKNYPGPGYSYDASRDAFIPPKPYPSWVLDEQSCWWNAPVPYPTDGQRYYWDESSQSWNLEG